MNVTHTPHGTPSWAIIFFMIAAFFVLMSVLRTRRPKRAGARECPECRTTCPSHANFCPKCGRRVANI